MLKYVYCPVATLKYVQQQITLLAGDQHLRLVILGCFRAKYVLRIFLARDIVPKDKVAADHPCVKKRPF